VSSSRELILARVRDALAVGSPAAAPVRDYRQRGALARPARIDLLCERLGDYRAAVRRVGTAGLARAIAEEFAARDAARVCLPAGIPTAWRPEGLELVEDSELSNAALDACDGVLTGCTLAIAETGTLVLTGGSTEGRRALTLIPDLHVCVVGEEQVVELVPEAMAQLGERVRSERAPITLISGPSATADIELSRVEGVHGPRTLVVLVVKRLAPASGEKAHGA
jgi:L-lactate dehydrogenase complex protein LldG